MKKIILSLIISVSFILNAFSVSTFALTQGTSSIGVSGTLNPGKTISVKVTITAARGVVDNFNANVSYSAEHLQYIPANDNKSNSTAAGVVKILNDEGNSATKSLTYTLSFKVLKVGTAEFKVYNIDANDGVDFIEVTGTSKKISITNPTKSDDNNLKSLKVGAGTLTPAFSPNVTEYSVTVPYSVDYFNIDAVKNHSGATLSYSTGDRGPAIKVGKTVRTVTVTAENGSVKKYNVTVTRLAQDETSSNTSSETVSTPEDTSLKVFVDGKDMLIKEDVTGVEKPVGLELGEYEYKGVNVPAFVNKDKSLIALYLEGEEVSGFYLYKSETDTFEALNYLDVNDKFILIPVTYINSDEYSFNTEDTFNLSVVTINNHEIPAYIYKDENLSDFVVICAQNSKGEIGYYTYDTKEGTIQRYIPQKSVITDTEKSDDLLSFLNLDTDSIVVLSCFALTIIVIVAIIIVWAVRRKKSNSQNRVTDEEESSDFDWVNEVIVGNDFSDDVNLKEEQDAKIDFEEFFTEQKNELSNNENTENSEDNIDNL